MRRWSCIWPLSTWAALKHTRVSTPTSTPLHVYRHNICCQGWSFYSFNSCRLHSRKRQGCAAPYPWEGVLGTKWPEDTEDLLLKAHWGCFSRSKVPLVIHFAVCRMVPLLWEELGVSLTNADVAVKTLSCNQCRQANDCSEQLKNVSFVLSLIRKNAFFGFLKVLNLFWKLCQRQIF